MTIEIRSLTLPSSLPLSILITNHDRLPEAVSVEFSNYLPADPKSAQRIAGMATRFRVLIRNRWTARLVAANWEYSRLDGGSPDGIDC
jgi:hypothetical protein